MGDGRSQNTHATRTAVIDALSRKWNQGSDRDNGCSAGLLATGKLATQASKEIEMIHLGQIIIAHSGVLLSIAALCFGIGWAIRDREAGE